MFSENLWSKYRQVGDVLTKGKSEREPPADPHNSFWVFADTASSFMILVGVFFPSVTGKEKWELGVEVNNFVKRRKN